jgi:hypothetical protein
VKEPGERGKRDPGHTTNDNQRKQHKKEERKEKEVPLVFCEMVRVRARFVFVISVWLNCVLLTVLVYRALFSGSSAVTAGDVSPDDPAAKGELCGLITNDGDGGDDLLVSGLAAGLARYRAYNTTTLRDVLVMIPARRTGDMGALWDAWGADLWHRSGGAGLEFFTFDDDSSPARPEDAVQPRLIETRPVGADGSVRVRQVVWHGLEKGMLNSLSDKVRRHLRWAAASMASGTAPYAGKRWFIKADTDTFLIPAHLEATLQAYDHTRPHYIGYQFHKGGCYYVSGGCYVLARAAFAVLGRRLDSPPSKDWRYEDMMVGCELNAEGIRPLDLKPFHWKRPWQR